MNLLCIDGNSLLNRAFYGVPLLSTQEGRYTNALVGFMNLFLALRETAEPELIVVAFDVKAPTFRHEAYPAYKAGRRGMPEELAEQFPVLKELLQGLGICMVEAAGFEADDFLGTFADLAARNDVRCVIATGDRDALQLVRPGVEVWLANTKETKHYTEALIFEEYGVTPQQLIEVKALMGDPSDNIPGVAGCGEKTALKLIQSFGTLDGVYENLDSPVVKPAMREKLRTGQESAYLSRELGRIRTDAPLQIKLTEAAPGTPDTGVVRALLEKFEMLRLLERLALPECAGVSLRTSVRETDPTGVLERLRATGTAYLAGQFSEDKQLERLLVSEEDQDIELPWSEALLQFLGDASVRNYVNDSKAFWHVCLRAGMELRNVVHDTSLAGYLLNPEAAGYDAESLQRAAGCESIRALVLWQQKALQAAELSSLYQEIELPLTRVLAEMERKGVWLDRAKLQEITQEIELDLANLTEEILALAGENFNLNSPKQLGEILFERLELKAPKKTKTGYSTNVEVLEALRDHHPIVPRVLEYRLLSKLKGTYCEGLAKAQQADGRVHSTFHQTETRTGRLSSTDPNLQNIPIKTERGRALRSCFTAPEGYLLVDADYSQIELRILASLSEERAMLAAFQDGKDIHKATAAELFDLPQEYLTPLMRSRAKTVNFGILYGMSAHSLAKDLEVPYREAKAYIERYFASYPKIEAFRAVLVEQAKERGFAETVFGRRRALPELRSTQRSTREFAERVAVNMPIQGTAADVIKIAMLRVRERLEAEKLETRMVLQVHDELLLEAPEREAEQAAVLLKEEMEAAGAAHFSVLLEAKVQILKNLNK